MERICPVCNNINTFNVKCIICGEFMSNLGRVQDFSDPYGADDPINDAKDYCNHLFKCENCNNKERIKVIKINI